MKDGHEQREGPTNHGPRHTSLMSTELLLAVLQPD